nr:hypothetical protein CPGR_03237 [Mycolicibacterium fortuitum subsp. fortuitum DSM 46621 = ATCC 6841 = JCM 6387]
MSVYGLKLRRTDPSDKVASISAYWVSSLTSMFLRQRLTILVRAIGPTSHVGFTFTRFVYTNGTGGIPISG